jgi:hypothetical protein
MPLPHITTGRVPRCRARSKRSGSRCLNMCAYQSPVCRMHGARRPESVSKGPQHPNYAHGNETLEKRAERSRKSAELHQLVDLGNAVGLFDGTARLRGRPPKGG